MGARATARSHSDPGDMCGALQAAAGAGAPRMQQRQEPLAHLGRRPSGAFWLASCEGVASFLGFAGALIDISLAGLLGVIGLREGRCAAQAEAASVCAPPGAVARLLRLCASAFRCALSTPQHPGRGTLIFKTRTVVIPGRAGQGLHSASRRCGNPTGPCAAGTECQTRCRAGLHQAGFNLELPGRCGGRKADSSPALRAHCRSPIRLTSGPQLNPPRLLNYWVFEE
jgi:hypothetical protein